MDVQHAHGQPSSRPAGSTLARWPARTRTVATWWAAALLGAAAAIAAAPAAHATQVGVSVSVSQPGVYGRIDIGRFPQPQLVVQQPVIVHRAAYLPPPVYVYAPPGHRKHWARHCKAYGACGAPVYFVTDHWYRQRVQPYQKLRPVVLAPAPQPYHWYQAHGGQRWDDRRSDWHDARDPRVADRRDHRQDRRQDRRDDRRQDRR